MEEGTDVAGERRERVIFVGEETETSVEVFARVCPWKPCCSHCCCRCSRFFAWPLLLFWLYILIGMEGRETAVALFVLMFLLFQLLALVRSALAERERGLGLLLLVLLMYGCG